MEPAPVTHPPHQPASQPIPTQGQRTARRRAPPIRGVRPPPLPPAPLPQFPAQQGTGPPGGWGDWILPLPSPIHILTPTGQNPPAPLSPSNVAPPPAEDVNANADMVGLSNVPIANPNPNPTPERPFPLPPLQHPPVTSRPTENWLPHVAMDNDGHKPCACAYNNCFIPGMMFVPPQHLCGHPGFFACGCRPCKVSDAIVRLEEERMKSMKEAEERMKEAEARLKEAEARLKEAEVWIMAAEEAYERIKVEKEAEAARYRKAAELLQRDKELEEDDANCLKTRRDIEKKKRILQNDKRAYLEASEICGCTCVRRYICPYICRCTRGMASDAEAIFEDGYAKDHTGAELLQREKELDEENTRCLKTRVEIEERKRALRRDKRAFFGVGLQVLG